MKKEEFIEALKNLTEQEDILGVNRDVDELNSKFNDYILEEERLFQIEELKAKDRNEEFTLEDWITPLKEEFYKIYASFKDKRKVLREAKKKEQEENLIQKRTLIAQFKKLISEEENIGAAFSTQKEINEKWKKVGDIPKIYQHEIQQEYSRLIEEFFYNIKIYKEIKNYDFKKNHDLKKEIIEKLKALLLNDDIKVVESEIKRLQNDWEDIGPTQQELWEEIKNEYWSTVNTIYDRIREHYEKLREEKKENIDKKKELIQKMESLLSQNRDSIKKWNSHTKEVLALQEEWKTIGFGLKRENEKVWKKFRSLCDEFFSAKSIFFKGAQDEFDKVAEVKKNLIEKVNAIKDSQNWKDTAKEIINLQKEWKDLGSAGKKYEAKLWDKFREACDHFFNSREAYFEEQNKEYDENLNLKKALIEEIDTFNLPSDKKQAIEQLKDFSQRFAAIGFVPAKQKDAIYSAYKEALFKHYESLDMKKIEKEKIMFEARIDTIKGSSNSNELFSKEKQAIKNEINTIKHNILQFENNLGFFVNNKGTNALKKQIEDTISREQEKLNTLKAKLKMIPNE